MYIRSILAGLLGLLVVPTAFCVAPPPRPLDPAVMNRLIEQLGDRDFRSREQAERELKAQSIAALPFLRKALSHRDAEVRKRALRMIPGLEHFALVAPKRITVSIIGKPLNVVLEEISKSSGYKVMFNNGMPIPARPGGAGEDTYTYRFVNTPFWDAIDRVCRDSNTMVQQSWGDEVVRLYQGGGQAPHVGRDGAFRYSAVNFQMYRSVDLGTVNPRAATLPSRTENLTFSFNIFSEPRLPFLGMNEIRIECAYDNERNSMLIKPDANDAMNGPWGPGGFRRRGYYGGGYKQTNIQASVNLQRPSEKATTLKLIKGIVPVTLLVEQKPMVISDKIMSAKGLKKVLGETEFHIENVQTMPNNQFQIKFTVTHKGKANDFTWMNTLYQRIELLDEKGNKFQNWGSSWGGNGANHVNLTLTYGHFGPGKAPTPTKFIYQHWVTRQHDIEFEFRDIPLP